MHAGKPPGYYTLRCQDVIGDLQAQGHSVGLLISPDIQRNMTIELASIALQEHIRRVAIVTHIVHPRLTKTNKMLVLHWFNIVFNEGDGAASE